MKRFLRERPWIWIVVAFLVLITGWSFLITIAVQNTPETIELTSPKGTP